MKIECGINKIIFIVLLTLFLCSCAYRSNQTLAKIREVYPDEVTSCVLLGQLYSDSIYPMLALGMEIAKDQAKQQALELGASHVVWTEVNIGNSYVAGKAYRCDRK